MENISKKIGDNIKIARKACNMTQTDMANILHMTQQQYSRFENGKYELNYQQIIDICDILSITPNEMFDCK